MIQSAEHVTPVQPGDVVSIVDETYGAHAALVTTVHGPFGGTRPPLLNVVYVSTDDAERDPYGQQIKRLSSLQHGSAASAMPTPGRYWTNAAA